MLGIVDMRKMRPPVTIVATIAVATALAMPASAPSAAADPRCAVPDALASAGEEGEARKEYVALLKSDPHLECAEKGLSGIDDSDATTAGSVFDWIERALPQYLLAGALALVVLVLVLLTAYIPGVRPRLVWLPLVGKILSPRFNFETLTDKSDKGVSEAIEARIKERLARMHAEATGSGGPGYELDRGTPRDDFDVLLGDDKRLKTALEKASEATEHTKLVGAVLSLLYALLPLRRLTVMGVVEPQAGPRASATLNLESNGRLVAAAIVLSPVSETPGTLTAADYFKVADPAAVWMQFEVAREIQGGNGQGPDAAESHAAVRAGLESQLAGKYKEARKFYEDALRLDQTNLAAYVNLAITEVALAPQPDYEAAVSILNEGFTAASQS
jgi:tetratricopeptide (TPR) repeat protein